MYVCIMGKVLVLPLLTTQDGNSTLKHFGYAQTYSKPAVRGGVLVSFSFIRLLYH